MLDYTGTKLIAKMDDLENITFKLAMPEDGYWFYCEWCDSTSLDRPNFGFYEDGEFMTCESCLLQLGDHDQYDRVLVSKPYEGEYLPANGIGLAAIGTQYTESATMDQYEAHWYHTGKLPHCGTNCGSPDIFFQAPFRKEDLVVGQQYVYTHDWPAVGLPAGTIVTVERLDTTPAYLLEHGRNIDKWHSVVVSGGSIEEILRSGGATRDFTRDVIVAHLAPLS